MDGSAGGSAQQRRRLAAVRLTDRDLALLGFAAQHRLILAGHAQGLLGLSAARASARLRELTAAGLLAREPARFHGRVACYQVTAQGLRAIGSRLTRPRFNLACYDHDVGLAWLYLSALAGRFGPARAVISERQMRSEDGRPDRTRPPIGVRLGGLGPGGRERIHYPDLVVDLHSGHRIAIELELTGKGRTRREQILSGYAADRRVDAVLYLAQDARVQRDIQRSAAALGLSTRVHVQRFRWGSSTRAHDPALARERGGATPGRERGGAAPGRERRGAAAPSAER